MIWAEVMIEGAVSRHMINRGQYGGGDGAHGFLWSATLAQPPELRLRVAGFFAGCRPGTLHQGVLEPGRTFAQASEAALSGALVVAWTEPGPGDEIPRGWEAA